MDTKKPGGDDPLVHFHVVDKRHFVDLDSVQTAEADKPSYPTYVEELRGKLAEIEKRFEQRKTEMLEEIAGVRTRLRADHERRLAIEKRNIVLPLLEVLDNLERAIDAARRGEAPGALLAGIEMTTSLFQTKLQALGVDPLEVLNRPFDPNLGQAIGTVPVDDPSKDGIVLDEIERGYLMEDELLRPAKVRVGRIQ